LPAELAGAVLPPLLCVLDMEDEMAAKMVRETTEDGVVAGVEAEVAAGAGEQTKISCHHPWTVLQD